MAPLFHRAAVVETVLIVLDDGRDRVEDVVALCPLRPDGTYWVTNCTPAPPG